MNRFFLRSRRRLNARHFSNSETGVDKSLVENTGSVARDHLANERTFLAWARTGLGFLALGIGIDSIQSQQALSSGDSLKFDKQKLQMSALGCIGTGGLILLNATRRFYSVQRALLQGKFRLAHGSITGIATLASCITIGAIGLLTFDNKVPVDSKDSGDDNEI